MDQTVLITGFAQLPKGTSLYEQNKIIGVVLVVDTERKIIQDAEFTLLTELANAYLKSIVKGYDMEQGINPLIEAIRKKILMPSQGALIRALRSAWDRYYETPIT